MNPLRIRHLAISNFRGVGGHLGLDLDADAVLISGGNGSGKTVIADAITWCIIGDIPALSSRQAGEGKKLDYVVSAFHADQPATVTLQLGLADRNVTLSRTGTARNSALTIDGDASDSAASVFGAPDDDTLRRALGSLAVLRQDVVSSFANDRSDERYASLRLLLGLGRLGDFEDATQRALTSAKAEAAAANDQLEGLRQRRRATQERLDNFRKSMSPEGRERLLAEARDLVAQTRLLAVTLPSAVDADAVADAGRELSTLVEELGVLGPVLSNVEAAASRPHTRDDVNRAEQQEQVAEAELARVAEQVPWHRLADAALPLIDDTCPVCQQNVDPHSVVDRLQSILDKSPSATADLSRAQAQVAEARTALKAVSHNHQRVRDAETARSQALSRWESVLTELRHVTVRTAGLEPGSVLDLRSEASGLRDRLREIYSTVAAPAAGKELDELETLLSELDKEVSAAELEALRGKNRLETAKRACDAAKQACLEVTADELKRLTPAFKRVYERLDPHPTFSNIGFFHQFSNTKGRTIAEATDPRTGVTTNPAIAFSEGQLNATAVALFTSLAMTIQSPLFPFVFLDDPLQALDGSSVLGLAELCRELRKHRQLIVTTHDRRFAALLGRKLAAREEGHRNLAIDLVGWRPDGPQFELRELPMDEPSRSVVLRAA